MTKNEKGITLMILVVTIIVIIILAGVVMTVNMNINKTVNLKEIVSNMELIKAAGSILREKYIDETEIENFIGIKEDVTDSSQIINQLLKASNRTRRYN